LHAEYGVLEHDEEHRIPDQEHGQGRTDAKPTDHQRQPDDAGDRVEEHHQRVEEIGHVPVEAGDETTDDAGDDADGRAEEQAPEARLDVPDEFAVERAHPYRFDDVADRRQRRLVGMEDRSARHPRDEDKDEWEGWEQPPRHLAERAVRVFTGYGRRHTHLRNIPHRATVMFSIGCTSRRSTTM
jgi:hypothetical protein